MTTTTTSTVPTAGLDPGLDPDARAYRTRITQAIRVKLQQAIPSGQPLCRQMTIPRRFAAMPVPDLDELTRVSGGSAVSVFRLGTADAPELRIVVDVSAFDGADECCHRNHQLLSSWSEPVKSECRICREMKVKIDVPDYSIGCGHQPVMCIDCVCRWNEDPKHGDMVCCPFCRQESQLLLANPEQPLQVHTDSGVDDGASDTDAASQAAIDALLAADAADETGSETSFDSDEDAELSDDDDDDSDSDDPNDPNYRPSHASDDIVIPETSRMLRGQARLFSETRIDYVENSGGQETETHIDCIEISDDEETDSTGSESQEAETNTADAETGNADNDVPPPMSPSVTSSGTAEPLDGHVHAPGVQANKRRRLHLATSGHDTAVGVRTPPARSRDEKFANLTAADTSYGIETLSELHAAQDRDGVTIASSVVVVVIV